MPKYAVKIGEIFIVSDAPISAEERKEISGELEGGFVDELISHDVIEIRINHPQP